MFEDRFSELQADMVSVCLEYADGAAEKIYIYGSFGENAIACDFFFLAGGMALRKHKINAVRKDADVSESRQRSALGILMRDIAEMVDLCRENEKPMPSEMKLIYDVKTGAFDANYAYGTADEMEPVTTESRGAKKWFELIAAENGSGGPRCEACKYYLEGKTPPCELYEDGIPNAVASGKTACKFFEPLEKGRE